MKMTTVLIAMIVLMFAVSAGVQAEVATYNFDDGTLQGWTNDSKATENMIAWDTATDNNGSRTVAHSGDYMVLEEAFGDRDTDTDVKVLSSPKFLISETSSVEIWTLGGVGGTATPSWTNYANLPTTATSGDFMGAALRRVSDGEYLLFSRRSASGQSNRTPNWLTIGWDAATIAAAVAGDSATEMYVVDIIDCYSGGWGWIGADDITLTDVTIPGPAYAPSPYDGQTGVATDVTLSWETGLDPNDASQVNPDIKMHYLYGNFANPTADPVYIGTIAVGTDAYGPLSLDSETTYEWYIEEAVDNGEGGYYAPGEPNNIAGPVWTFYTVTPRLIAHWGFEGDLTSVDKDGAATPYTGSYVADGNSIDPSSYFIDTSGDPNAPSDTALLFLDDPNYVEIADPDGAFDTYPQGFTVASWINPSDVSGNRNMVSRNDYDGNTGWLHRVRNEYIENRVYNGSSYEAVTTGTIIAADTWYYVVTTFEPGVRLAIYVDGLLVKEDTTDIPASIPTTTAPLTFGADALTGGGNPFVGLLDEVKIWNYALTPREVAQEYVNITDDTICLGYPTVDLDHDCDVDLADLAILAANWMQDTNIYPQ